MSILNKKLIRVTNNFAAGVHTVKLTGFSETDGGPTTKANGETYDAKATIVFNLQDNTGAQDKHVFYYAPVPVMDEENDKVVGGMSDQDTANFVRILNNIKKQQTGDIATEQDPYELLTKLVTTGAEFKVLVTKQVSEDNTRTYTNYNYDLDLIRLVATL